MDQPRSIESLSDRGEILVAVKFDAAAPYLIRAAAALARRARRRLRLVHVHSTDLPAYPSAFLDVPGLGGAGAELRRETYVPIAGDNFDDEILDGSPGVYTDGERSPIEHSRATLREYARLHAPDLPADAVTLVGSFPETLLAHATSCGAGLVITGAATRDPGFFRSKLKATIRMMAKAELPVLVLKDSLGPFELPDRSLRILLADDLTDASLPALRSTAALLELLGLTADVLHLHVEPQPSAEFALSPEFALEVWPGVSIRERLVSEQHERLLAQLRARAQDLETSVTTAGGRYRTQLWHGRVGEELCRAAAVHQADLTVFGHHKFLHRDPWTLGQMSFGAMLNLGSAILVAPA